MAAESYSPPASPAETAIADQQTPEDMLRADFPQLLAGLCLQNLMVPLDQRTISQPDEFRLTPLVDRGKKRTLSRGGFVTPDEDGLRLTYAIKNDEGGRPYIDTRQSIGLVYKNHLIALASAGIHDETSLVIRQIQDVTDVRKQDAGKDYYKTGLHNGFLWRDTLVSAWEQIARQICCQEVVVQSYVHSIWKEVRARDSNYAYDDVALRMGYSRTRLGRNWRKPL